jgi:hypothetical protein
MRFIERWFGRGPRRRMRLSERLFNRFVLIYYGRNLAVDLQLAAKRESVEYIRANMRQAMMMRDRWDLLDYALAKAPADGLVLEFGVAGGDSLRHIGRATGRLVHGFDSFEGLPEDWQGTFERRGKFSTFGRRPRIPANARLHVGWFDDVLPAFLAETAGPVAFLHIDCDLYSSTKIVLDRLGPRLAPGAVIVFDEYFNYPNWQEHEFRAFQEFVRAQGRAYEYIAFSAKNGHVAVRLI